MWVGRAGPITCGGKTPSSDNVQAYAIESAILSDVVSMAWDCIDVIIGRVAGHDMLVIGRDIVKVLSDRCLESTHVR